MISDHDRLLMIDQCEYLSIETFFIYRPTWQLITKALTWSMGKTSEEIIVRIGICRYKQGHAKLKLMKNNWQLIINTLRWVLEETETDPIQSRKDLIPFA